jgi:hypothetical protein
MGWNDRSADWLLVGFALVRVLLLSAKHLFLATALLSCGEVFLREAPEARRLSAHGRAELEQRRERLQRELRLIEGELRTDLALRLQQKARSAAERPKLAWRWRDWVE